MSDERIAKLEKSLQTLRRQVDLMSLGQRDTYVTLTHAVLASVLSGGIVALTATTWRGAEDTERDRTYVDTLWSMVPDGWLAAVAVLFVGTVEPPGMVDVEDYDTAPGRWLTLVGTLVLAAVHGARANHLR